MELARHVIDRNGKEYEVLDLVLRPVRQDNESITVSYENFIDAYEEYVDPKDVEIKRLLGIIQELEEAKIVKPTRRHLTKEERDEVKSLYEQGITVQDIAREYAVSDSSIYKWAKDNHWEIKG